MLFHPSIGLMFTDFTLDQCESVSSVLSVFYSSSAANRRVVLIGARRVSNRLRAGILRSLTSMTVIVMLIDLARKFIGFCRLAISACGI
jgi:hypothetical protein